MSVLIVTEQRGGQWHKMSWEAVAAGQQIAKLLEIEAFAAVVGSGVESLGGEVAKYKLTEVILCNHELLADYTPDGFSLALRQAIEHLKPEIVIFPHTYQVRDFAPKLAASFGKPFLSDVVGVTREDAALIFVRQLFQGKLNADVSVEGEAPFFVSVQSGAFRGDSAESASAPAAVRGIDVTLEASQIRTRPQKPFRESKGEVDLSSAPIIVSVGRGIKEAENIAMAEELARLLGGEIAASRPICDNGWLPLERQIGSSGQTVSPKLYLALGISGAIQHVVGMKGSRTVVAVNKDESAPIFEIADYGIVGDLFDVVPALVEALKESSGD
ncbi:MAG: electron transfer flavoprotein subunit alpha/FixB family protein [Bryobacterales bacterium]